jgi:hypothetical protein
VVPAEFITSPTARQFDSVAQDAELNSAWPLIAAGSIRAQPLPVSCSAIGAEVFAVPAEPAGARRRLSYQRVR